MSKSTPALDKLALELSVLKARDAKRTREIRALRGDLDAIEAMLAREREQLAAACATVDTVSPAANSTGLPSGPRAGTALNRARLFLRRLWFRVTS